MFGYVRPVFDQLSEEAKEEYKSAYCGLCHAMGRRHGWLSRFTLNYDFTFLVLLFQAVLVEDKKRNFRCPAHPFKKAKCCFCGDKMDLAADESVILTWYKLVDDIFDKGFFAGLPARLLCLVFHRAYIRAAEARPAFDQNVRNQMDRLGKLEKINSDQLDRLADTFAQILAGAVSEFAADDNTKRVMTQLLYHLGRWIYLIDAWDDLDEDLAKDRYNPINARFNGAAVKEREYIETTITHSARLVQSAANLLNFGRLESLIENILCVGLPAVQTAVLNGQWKQVRKQRRKKHERSV